MTTPLASEKVIINAPMSFAGSAQRTWRLRARKNKTWVWTTLAILILTLWWPMIAVWYVVFGVCLIPYRLLRRGTRKRKAEALRHRETMALLERRGS